MKIILNELAYLNIYINLNFTHIWLILHLSYFEINKYSWVQRIYIYDFPFISFCSIANPRALIFCDLKSPHEVIFQDLIKPYSLTFQGIISPHSVVNVPLVIESQALEENEILAYFMIFGSADPPLVSTTA